MSVELAAGRQVGLNRLRSGAALAAPRLVVGGLGAIKMKSATATEAARIEAMRCPQ